MADITVLGTAAADVIVRVATLPGPGEHVSGTAGGWRLGGGSANVACALASDGHNVQLFGPFGTDAMGEALLAELQRRNVGTERSFRVPASSPRALILLDASGERTIVGLDEAFAKDVYPLRAVPDLGHVDGAYVETYRRFPTDIADHAQGALIMTSMPPEGATSWPADVLVGSERDVPSRWRSSPFESARLVAGPRLRWVVVTRGRAGADAYGASGLRHVDARPVTQVNATGAGDAFAAGLMSAFVAGGSIDDALAHAADLGAAAVAELGSLPSTAIEALVGPWEPG
jgi:sugar/nucleoside kinase (ribokinase family)